MKKFFICLLFLSSFCFASEENIMKEQSIQAHINLIGNKILNSNKIENRIVFVYDTNEKKSLLKIDESVTKRQVVLYDGFYKFIEDDNELAAFLAREICVASKTYDGIAKGWLRSIQIKSAPKKYEIVADKTAVDFMVKAGYNPIALITFINKTFPQGRQDLVSTHNLTSKRLAYIYEYIYSKYPYFLENNEYINNEYYQNFLLTSVNNRKLFEEKIHNGTKGKIKYE